MPTLNMGLTLPSPNSTPGPTWATQLNTAFSTIDLHDHSSGKGVKVTPAGFNFTANMDVKGYSLTDVGSVNLKQLSVGLTTAGAVHNVNGNLYWVSAGGTPVQITDGTGLNLASIGAIGGDYGQAGVTASVVYSNALKSFIFSQDSGVAAKMVSADLSLYYPGAGEQAVTLKAVTGTTAYSISFPPATPVANDSLLTLSTSGIGAFKQLLGTSNQVTITSNSGNLTFSLPQDIHTGASPSFTDLTLTGGDLSFTTANGSAGLDKIARTASGTFNLQNSGLVLTASSAIFGGTIEGTDLTLTGGDLSFTTNTGTAGADKIARTGAGTLNLQNSGLVLTSSAATFGGTIEGTDLTLTGGDLSFTTNTGTAGADKIARTVAGTLNINNGGIIVSGSAVTLGQATTIGTLNAGATHNLNAALVNVIDGNSAYTRLNIENTAASATARLILTTKATDGGYTAIQYVTRSGSTAWRAGVDTDDVYKIAYNNIGNLTSGLFSSCTTAGAWTWGSATASGTTHTVQGAGSADADVELQLKGTTGGGSNTGSLTFYSGAGSATVGKIQVTRSGSNTGGKMSFYTASTGVLTEQGSISNAGAWALGPTSGNVAHQATGKEGVVGTDGGEIIRFQARNTSTTTNKAALLIGGYSTGAGTAYAWIGSYENGNVAGAGLKFASYTTEVGGYTSAGAWTLGPTSSTGNNLTVNGYSALGNSTTAGTGGSTPNFAVKKLTGTLANSGTVSASVAHGLTKARIKTVTGKYAGNSGYSRQIGVIANSAAVSTASIDCYWDDTNVYLDKQATNVTESNGAAYVLYIEYEAS